MFKGLNEDLTLAKSKVKDVMTANPEAIPSYSTVAQALNTLGASNFRHLPVLRESGKIGQISTKGLLNFIHKKVLKD